MVDIVGSEVYSSPAINSDGTIYIGSWDSYLYALNPLDGSLIWKYKTEDGFEAIIGSVAIAAEGTLYLSARDGLHAVNPDGTKKWFLRYGGGSSPAIGSDGTIYIGSSERLLAIGSGDLDGNDQRYYGEPQYKKEDFINVREKIGKELKLEEAKAKELEEKIKDKVFASLSDYLK